ncbi:MAG: hypothetical protein GX996_08350 [Firmicutes bacterium]|nr:hypothetical protein [Bacillota bacterium]
MKRTLLVAALVLAVSTSIIAGTLAMYTVSLPNLAEGSVVAKEFVLKPGETNTFSEEIVGIAPGETVDWDFSVKNYDGEIVSETGMDLEFTVDITDTDENNAIAPLVVTIKDQDKEEGQEVVGTKTGTGTVTFTDEDGFEANVSGEKTYTVSIEWPWETEDVNDIDYAGADYGTSIKVSVTGTQQQQKDTTE